MARHGPATAGSLTFAVVFVSWGLNYLFVRWGLDLAAPLWLALLRAAVGAAGVFAALLVRPAAQPLQGRRRALAIALGVPNTAVFFGLWFVAGAAVPPGVTAVFIYTYPLWVAVLAVPLLGYRIGPSAVLALVLGFAGVTLLSEPWSAAASGLAWLPVAELLAAAIAWAVGTVLMQRLYAPAEMASANAHQLLGGAVGLAVGSLIFSPTQVPAVSPSLVVVVAWLGLVGTALAYGLWYRLLGRIHAATLSGYAFLVPVVALVASFFVYGERLQLVQVAGVGLVLIAIVLVGRGSAAAPRYSAVRTT